MGRTSINWMNPDVQQSIDDYICRRIPTQSKLRQVISGHLQKPVSEQALSIYLKRTGVSFPRKVNSPNDSAKFNANSNAKQSQNVMASAPHSLEHFYAAGGQPLFMNALSGMSGTAAGSASESPSAASSSALIVDASGGNSALNFVHVSSSQAAAFNNILDMSRNSTTNNTGNNNNMLNMNNNNNIQRYILDDSQQQQLRTADIQHNLQLQQQALSNHWHQQQQQQHVQQETPQQHHHHQQQQQQQHQQTSINNNNANVNGVDETASSSAAGASAVGGTIKRKTSSSQPINWKDPVVQQAIAYYFSRGIKMQTELRHVIMDRLNRNVSENSLRLYLKKVKNRFQPCSSDASTSSSTVHNLLTDVGSSSNSTANSTALIINDAFRNLSTSAPSTSGGKSAADHSSTFPASGAAGASNAAAVSLIGAPSKEIAYYFCNNLAPMGAYGASPSTGQMPFDAYGLAANVRAGDLVGKSLQLAPTATMVKTINDQFFKVHSQHHQSSELHQNQPQQHQHEMDTSNGSKRDSDDTKPSVRRRINWNNADVQNAINDFYGRKILTQAKLRTTIEKILGQAVSEQALSIYLKRKKSRSPISEEIVLMNANCGEENMS